MTYTRCGVARLIDWYSNEYWGLGRYALGDRNAYNSRLQRLGFSCFRCNQQQLYKDKNKRGTVMRAGKFIIYFLTGYLFLLTGMTVAGELSAPEKVVIETSEKMLKILKEKGAVLQSDKQKIFQLVNEIIIPHIDIVRMSRWVLGKHWRKASAAEQEQFTKEFQTLLLRTYATAMTEYSGQTFKYHPLKLNDGDTDVTIKTELQQPGGYPIPISYSLHTVNGEWKVYDITIDGISLVANYRTSFSAQIKRGGLQDLIKRLMDKNAKVAS